MNSPAYLHCLYAEDVRQEVSGQLSMIGVYQGGLRVQTIPTTLPKFAVISNLFSPKDHKPASVKLEVCQNGDVLESMEPPPYFFTTIEKEATSSNVVDGYHMQFVITFNGFILNSAAMLRVRATVNGQVIYGNPLLIQIADQSLSTPDSQPIPADQ